jgi:hypothetical protein
MCKTWCEGAPKLIGERGESLGGGALVLGNGNTSGRVMVIHDIGGGSEEVDIIPGSVIVFMSVRYWIVQSSG